MDHEADCQTSLAGSYAIEASANMTGACSAGYYCPAGSTGPQQVGGKSDNILVVMCPLVKMAPALYRVLVSHKKELRCDTSNPVQGNSRGVPMTST